jgi:UDP-galactopyranose mutase
MLGETTVHLNVEKNEWKKYSKDFLIYTGKIDEFYDYRFNRLPYRSLNFVHTVSEKRMDYVVLHENNKTHKHTRTYDHSYFTYDYKNILTVITTETPMEHTEFNLPYYPMPLKAAQDVFEQYKTLSKNEANTIFIGRLANYKYFDMDSIVNNVFKKLQNI